MPGPAGTRGSNPRTTAPAERSPAAISDPASPSPSTATTGGPELIAASPRPGGLEQLASHDHALDLVGSLVDLGVLRVTASTPL